MLKKHENKFSMAKNTAAFLGENNQIISALPELSNHLTLLKEKCVEIESKDNERITIRQGKYLNKVTEKNKAINRALGITGGVYAYAKKSRNIELAEKSNIFRSELINMRDSALLAKFRFIKELAEENLNSLETYGINQQKINDFSDKINSYEKTVSDSGGSFAVKKGNLKTINELFNELSSLLASTDKLIDSFIDEYPEFVYQYNSIRRIKYFGIRHRKELSGQSAEPGNTENRQSTS